MYLPYASLEQRALASYRIEGVQDQRWGTTRTDAQRYFIAGDGDEQTFDELWRYHLDALQDNAQAVAANTFHTPGGTIYSLAAATRPA